MPRWVAAPFLLGTLAACSGGGGDSSVASISDQSPAGLWTGTVTRQGVLINHIGCIIIAAGDLSCSLTDAADEYYAGFATGKITAAGDRPSGSGTLFAGPGFELNDGSTVARFTVTGGAIDEHTSIRLNISAAGANDVVAATFNPDYDRSSSLDTVAASYSDAQLIATPALYSIDSAVSLSIDSAGVLFAQGGSGCTINGQVGLIDPSANAYTVSATLSGCPSDNGSYEGLGLVFDYQQPDDSFVFIAFSDQQTWLRIEATK